MTTAAAVDVLDLLDHLRSLEVRLWIEDDRLRFRAPRGVLTDALKREMKAHKTAILDFLRHSRTVSEASAPAIEPVRRDGPQPLSFSQERLWFLEQWRPPGVAAAAAYNVVDAVRLRGAVAPLALGRALSEIVRRHEILRTTFAAPGGRPLQVIHAAAAASGPLAVADLGALPAAHRDAEFKRRLADLALLPFDLAHGPLVRAALLRLASDHHVLVLGLHHIVSDGWSSGVLIRELSALYAKLLDAPGKNAVLPALPIQYADFAVWQRRWLESPAFARQLEVWRRRLEGAEGVLELPTDRPRLAVRSFRGAACRFRIEAPLCDGLDRLAERGTTRFMTLLTAFAALAGRTAGSDDVLVGTPVANRRRPELELLIGFFVNTLVLRGDLGGNPTARELLGRVRDVALEAFAGQDVPFEKLVEALKPERDPGLSPLFQVMFVLQNAPMPALEASGVRLEPLVLENRVAKFDLTLTVVDGRAPLAAVFEYSTDLFDRTTVERLARRWTRLLAGLLETPGRRLSELEVLDAAERFQILREWNDTGRPGEAAPLLHDLVAQRVAAAPAALAVVGESEAHLSYGELAARVRRLAHHLRRRGVGPDSVVGVYLERSVELPVALLAVLEAGGAYLPLDPDYPAERIAFMLADAGVELVVTIAAFAGEGALAGGAARVLLDADAAAIAACPATRPVSGVVLENLAYVLYTSGSTGRPKGVMISHRAIGSHMRWMAEAFPLEAGDRMLQKTPMSFDASVWEIFAPLAFGATLVMARPDGHRDAGYLAERLRERRITVVQLVPSQLRLLLESPSLDEAACLRRVFCGGEAFPTELAGRLAQRLDVSRYNLYGPTEASINTTLGRHLPDRDELRALVPLGRPRADGRVHVVDGRGSPAPVGVPGELVIGGAGLARGYGHRPALTAERFVPDPFAEEPGERLYRTGDLGRWLPEGELDFVGRLDHQIKLRGYRIELGEIEAVLERHPAVREAVALVCGAADHRHLVAWVAPAEERGEAEISPEELRAFAHDHLPEHMVPVATGVLAELPRTPAGKLDRRALEAVDPRIAAERGPVEPRTATEEVLAEIWSEVLDRARISVHDDFFTLGGHSLLATQIIARIEQALAIAVPLRQLFEAPTIAGLAERVEIALAAGDAAPIPLERAPRGGPLPLSFSQERLWLFERMVPGTAIYNTCRAGHLRGPLDVPALRATFDEILRRHEALRTRYAEHRGEPVQIIEPARPMALPMIDLQALPAERREPEALLIAERENQTPLGLDRAPLARAAVLRLATEEHVVLLTIHHICWDLWSGGVLLRELEALYPAFVARRPSPLPGLAMQYADFAAWQRRAVAGAALATQLDYWRRHLAGLGATPLTLPVDRPRPAVETFRGGTLRFQIDAAPGAAFRELGRRRGATQFISHLALFKALLYRLAPQRDLVVGAPISNRNAPQLEAVIGFFDNLLVLRTDSRGAGARGFDAFLTRVREIALGAYAHQHVPFERLVRELCLERDGQRAPLVQAVFLFALNYPAMARELAGLRMRPYPLGVETAKFELTLSLREDPEGWVGQIDYSAELFDATTVRRLAAYYGNLLQSVVDDVRAPLATLDFLGRADRHQLLAEWSDAGTEPRGAPALLAPALLAAVAARRPGATAVVGTDGELTYGELEHRAARLAARLRDAGVGPESRVGVLAGRSPELIAALYAVWKAGGAYVPLDPGYPEARLAFMLEDAGAVAVITETRFAPRLTGAATIVLLDGREGHANELPEGPASDPESLAYVIYTSGSTGRPKGVEVRHGGLRRLIDWHRRAFGLTASDRTAHVAGLGFDASVWEIWPTLTTGACLELPEEETRAHPERLRDWLLRRGVTVSFLPTPLAESVLDFEWPAETRLRCLLTGGDRLRRRPRPDLPFVLVNNYGPTENTVVATSGAVSSQGPAPPDIGQPIDRVTARVIDPTLRLLPVSAAGELVIGGENLARGYLARPALTAGRFVPDPWSAVPGSRLYRTGDLTRWRRDGTIDFVGRIDHQVKVRGYRIELGEIEAALLRQPAVDAGAVLAPETVGGDRRLVAWVTPAADNGRRSKLEVMELRAALAESLPDYMVPSAFVVVEAMPLTPHGKIDREALARTAPEAGSEGIRYAPPRTAAEEVLAAIWADLLERSRVGLDDDFFALGGHSLLATRLASRVRSAFEVELPLEVVFTHPTLAQMAQAVESARRGEASGAGPVIEPVPRNGDLPLAVAQERMWFLDQLQPGDPAYHIPVAVRLRGPLDVAALENAVEHLVRRHESLRTTFHAIDDRPVQRIAPAGRSPLGVRLADLRALPEARREAALRDATTAESRRPFDLARGPLLRVVVYRLTDREHVLLWTLHHIIGDGWSMAVFVAELRELYAAASAGRPLADVLPPLVVQPADVAVAQRRWLASPPAATQLEAWRQELADPPVLDLPADAPPTASSRAGRHGQTLSPELSDAVRALGRSRGASLFMTLVTALDVVLYRQTGESDLTVGYPIAGRERGETEGLIGVFLNTLVLRTRVDGGAGFSDLLDQVRRSALAAYGRQAIPFEQLLTELQVERDLQRTPLFQVFVNMLSFPEPPATLGELVLEPLPLETPASKFDLTLYAAETTDGIRIDWVYRADRFRPARIAALAEQLAAALAEAATDPETPVDQLEILTPAARAVLPDPTMPLPRRFTGTVVARFAAVAGIHPGRTALVDEVGAWSYADLDTKARRLAAALAASGVGRGDVVAIYGDRSAGLPLAILGTLGAGAAFTVLDGAYPESRLARQLRIASPRALISTATAGPLPGALGVILDELGAPRIVLPATPAAAAPDLDAHPGMGFAEAGADDLAYLAFTSGSTGEPRAVEGTHAPLTHFVDWHATTFELGAGDRFAMLSGLAHDPLLRDALVPLALGARLAVPSGAVLGAPAALRAWLADEGVSVVHLTPAMAQLLAQDAGDCAATLPALRRVFFSGDVLRGRDVALLRAIAPNVRAVGFYGATETPQAMASQPIADDHPPALDVPLGRGIDGVQILVLTAQDRLAAIGELGEIVVRTPYLARGYRGDPAATTARFEVNPFTGDVADRIYRTGDLGRFEPDGTVRFAGRRDGQVKIRGFRVETGEVEWALEARPEIARAVVVATPFGDCDRRLAAYLVAAGEPPPVAALRDALAAELPAYMVPAVFVFLDQIPLTPNGKVDRRALPAPGESAARDGEWLAPRDDLEKTLTAIFEELLGVRPVGVRDDFFALGGHSLVAVRLRAIIRRRLGRGLPLAALFEGTTVERLAERLRGLADGARERPVRVPITPGGDTCPPLFLVHPIGGNVLCYGELATLLSPELPVEGLQTPSSPLFADLETMAAHYLVAVRERQPAGPLRLAGWSMGGVVAFEMARQLAAAGEEVAFLGLIDASPSSPGPLADDELARAFAADLASLAGRVPSPRELEQDDDVRELYSVFRLNHRLLASYRPRPYPGSLTFFRAAAGRAARSVPWDGLAARVDTIDLPGDHYEVMGGKGVRRLAQEIRSALQAS